MSLARYSYVLSFVFFYFSCLPFLSLTFAYLLRSLRLNILLRITISTRLTQETFAGRHDSRSENADCDSQWVTRVQRVERRVRQSKRAGRCRVMWVYDYYSTVHTKLYKASGRWIWNSVRSEMVRKRTLGGSHECNRMPVGWTRRFVRNDCQDSRAASRPIRRSCDSTVLYVLYSSECIYSHQRMAIGPQNWQGLINTKLWGARAQHEPSIRIWYWVQYRIRLKRHVVDHSNRDSCLVKSQYRDIAT